LKALAGAEYEDWNNWLASATSRAWLKPLFKSSISSGVRLFFNNRLIGIVLPSADAMRRRVALHSILQRRTVIEFDFRSPRRQRYWLFLEPTDVSVCLKHPGLDVDVMVSAEIIALYRVWLGRATLAEALHRKQVRLEGGPADLRAFPQ
jgi:hypothetical protein